MHVLAHATSHSTYTPWSYIRLQNCPNLKFSNFKAGLCQMNVYHSVEKTLFCSKMLVS
jgi:hypothetical protein